MFSKKWALTVIDFQTVYGQSTEDVINKSIQEYIIYDKFASM